MRRHFFALLAILFALTSCSGVSFLSGPSISDLYRKEFLQNIDSIKEMYRVGEAHKALIALERMDEQALRPAEKAMRRNLLGVIYFSRNDYEKAIYHFELALMDARQDAALASQIRLNLGSTYFKLNMPQKAFNSLALVEYHRLDTREAKKFHKLKATLAKELGKNRDRLASLALYLSDINDLMELKSSPLYQELMNGFFSLTPSEKIAFLEEYERDKPLVIGHLGYLEVEKRYYAGSKEKAKNLLDWVDERFGKLPEIERLVQNFHFRMENYVKMDPSSIGVVLPLSGSKSNYGERTLMGLDSAFKSLVTNAPEAPKFNLVVRDSKGSGAVGAFRTKELIEKHHVSAIIGGLLASEATKEYLVAKRHGVFFISLSPIYLPKEEKDHLLLEIPGSVESQLNELFSPEVLQRFGRKGAIIYPESERGQIYLEEFWRKASTEGVQVTDIASFKLGATQFEEPIKNVLGLQFKRERQEELDILSEIHALKRLSTRRLQDLKPIIDFDWVFIPAVPKETELLVPFFKYYDAFGINIFGNASWRSKALSKRSHDLGRLYFVAEDVEVIDSQFRHQFTNLYKRSPSLMEMRAFDAFRILHSILNQSIFSSRDELDIFIRTKDVLAGLTGTWELKDGVWLKKMAAMELYQGRLERLSDKPVAPDTSI